MDGSRKTHVVLFKNRPIWLVLGGKKEVKKDVRKVVEVWGFRLDDPLLDAGGLQDYISYLITTYRWTIEGGVQDHYRFTSFRTGETYDYDDPYILGFKAKACEEVGLTWGVYETSKVLDASTPGMRDDFISSRKLYKNLLEFGAAYDIKGDDGKGRSGNAAREYEEYRLF